MRKTLINLNKFIYKAFKNFFDKSRKKLSGYPKFRSRYEKKFYVRYDKLKAGINLNPIKDKNTISRALKNKPADFDITKRVYLECIGWVKVSESERFIGITSFKNPRVKFDGKHWYLTVAVEVSPEVTLLTDEVIGVDLGVKELRKLEKQKKRLQRQSARKYKAQRQSGTAVIKGEHLMKSNNQKKLEERISSLCRRQANIRNTYMCQVVSDLVKTHPRAIVMENLNVTGMLKNGKLSRSIQEQAFGAILNQTE